MKNLFCCLVILIISNYSYVVIGQNLSQEAIEAEYTFVLGKIERADYFINEFKINANRNKQHFEENFQHFERYHYVFDPRQDSAKSVILKAIVILTERYGVQRFEQFVYDNSGNLIVYYEEKKKPGESPHEINKLLIQKKKVVAWQSNEEDQSQQDYRSEGYLLMRSERLQKNFYEQMQRMR